MHRAGACGGTAGTPRRTPSRTPYTAGVDSDLPPAEAAVDCVADTHLYHLEAAGGGGELQPSKKAAMATLASIVARSNAIFGGPPACNKSVGCGCSGCAAAEGRGAVSLEQPRCEGPQHGL